MNFEDRLSKLSGVLEKLRSKKFNALWGAIVLICLVAAYSGYCVEISWSDGFSFSKCVGQEEIGGAFE